MLHTRTRRLSVARVAAATLMSATLTATVPLAPAEAASRPVDDTIAPEWGQGVIRIVRNGWTVNVTGRLTDIRADGDCVYVEAVLAVDDWTDPDSRIPDHCGGPSTSVPVNLSLTPGKGSKLSSIRVRVCAADSFKDSCLERTYPVPPEQAVQPGRKARIDGYMNAPMAEFRRARAARPGPFDWDNDSCSNSPDRPARYDFSGACARHDFGYRNYGVGPIQAAPFDDVRAGVDARFRADMFDECARWPGLSGTECRGFAKSYHQAVRKAGGRPFYS